MPIELSQKNATLAFRGGKKKHKKRKKTKSYTHVKRVFTTILFSFLI